MIYTTFIQLYALAIRIASYFNKKAALLYEGRKQTRTVLLNFKRDTNRKLVWFHCASLGEFEQARPIIEAIKKKENPQIAISFFSPSGYQIRKNYELADVVFYLPSDTVANAQFMLQQLQPSLVFVVKYEIWLNWINTIFKKSVPLYLISATFHPGQIYFKWYGWLFKSALKKFNLIFVQNQKSLHLLEKHGLKNVLFSNDTRFDRVYETSINTLKLDLLSAFKNEQTILILGSSYADEERLAAKYLEYSKDNIKIIIAPHQIDESRLQNIEGLFKKYSVLRYSQTTLFNAHKAKILLMDNVGYLAKAYQYADVAIVGGGFGNNGIHNVLEAVAFGMPVFIGPKNHDKFPEVGLLQQQNILRVISNEDDFMVELLAISTNISHRVKVKELCKEFILNNIGATQIVLQHVKL
ncbi:MAG: 3-deoxy-D-manno-octulosonic acid transferase [Bacteroidia bacterium]|nr:3-deoxy-D-manno-octulosonic acid transferase [Bacteroidia bacterium]MCZ2141238.1 3-deoxy-D-manno-octulosonic acid transferase [Bacteroidia bacterium]